MGFKVNFDEAVSYDIKPEGEYECIITDIKEKQTKNGAMGLNFSLIIRNDVPGQKFGNSYLFYTIWKKREPTASDRAVNGYNFGQLMALGNAAAMTNGKEYDTLEDYLKDLLKHCIRVTLRHEEYNGKKQERINEVSPTKFPDCRHVFKNAAANGDTYAKPADQGFISATDCVYAEIIDDDGVPF